jgi:hypothetical protein
LDDNKDGKLSRRGIWIYFRSFLTAILCFVGGVEDCRTDIKKFISLIDDAVLYICNNSVWTDCESEVSFDEIAEWYSRIGFKLAPWLELLDVIKWSLFQSIST